MKKLTDDRKDCLNSKKRRISLNLLTSYLMILMAPAVAVVVVYFMAQSAMVDTQKERIASALSEVRAAFDREVEEAQNVGYYVSREKSLSSYLYRSRKESRGADFYDQYAIASTYPNYSLTNQAIKNVYILIAGSQYVIRIPQVIPQTDLGISTLDGFPFYSYENFMEFYQSQDREQTLFYQKGEAGGGTLFLPCQLTYSDVPLSKCAIIVELNWAQMSKMMRPVLSGKEGMVALLDGDGNILEEYKIANGGVSTTGGEETSFEELLKAEGWSQKNAVILSEQSVYNGWKLVSVVPKRVLTERIGLIRYLTISMCWAALLTGTLVCLAYWYRRKNVVQEYFNLQERMESGDPAAVGKARENVQFWKNFEGFLSHVDDLNSTVARQEAQLQEDFLRKLLYGSCESGEQLDQDAGQFGFPVDEGWFCVASIEFEDPMRSGSGVSREAFQEALRELFHANISGRWWRYCVSELNNVLLTWNSQKPDRSGLKGELERMNFELYSRFEVKSYIGISYEVRRLREVAGQYEASARISEFARYQGIRVPMLPEELPKEQILQQPLFFTFDMEMKLMSQIRSGNQQQIQEMIDQILSVYFRRGNSRYTYRHTIEILRGCLFRSVPTDKESPQISALCEKIAKAENEEQIFTLMKEVGKFWEKDSKEREETSVTIDREKIVAYIDENFGNPCLNLSMLSEWLGESERKLYNDFKACFGVSFSSYLEQRRIACACELLKNGTAVKETAEKTGYCSDYSFRRAFKRAVGVPPSDFRKIRTT